MYEEKAFVGSFIGLGDDAFGVRRTAGNARGGFGRNVKCFGNGKCRFTIDMLQLAKKDSK